MNLLADLQTFSQVAKSGSFSAAARALGIPQPLASRRIAFLEQHYGVRLIQRTTRSLMLTEEGRALLCHVAPALGVLDTARDAVRALGSSVGGVVRIGAPAALGVLVGARLGPILERYPDLTVDLSIGEAFGRMIEEGLDLVVTTAGAPDPSLIGRRIGQSPRILVASPDYLRRTGQPEVLADLGLHSCIVDSAARPDEFVFDGPFGAETAVLRGRLRTNSSEVVRRAALDGVGIGLLAELYVAKAIESGALRRVLPGHSCGDCTVEVLYPSRRDLPARTRLVIDFLIRAFGAGSEGGGTVVPLRRARQA
jgi:DNA-binding transcriptional LysR family regulator